ncbi:MAG: DUF1330 domain-containing protein [Aquincola tertiaricarbonis]|uniref:DUF1330 domain-containing protein n=1 Tax=Aquincola TaxID=391952 RepID=UPI0006151A2B|nr:MULTISPECIES: DUF1330 domain-containing protein [Aquincola]MCR5868509.1 DUF1330 domain-containing protein [Aquincola sp. J276]
MSALVLIDLDIRNEQDMAKYEDAAIALLAQHGARPIVRDLKPVPYEGEWTPNFLVVLEFPSKEAVRRFYDSPEYEPLKQMRFKAAKSNGIVVVDTLSG